ncbi:hypothetical protein F2Q68_00032967, partial [Brassica cretica]
VTVHDGVSESPDRYDTFDLSDNLIFAIDGGIRNIRRKRVLCDYTGIPLPSMKTMVVHDFSWGGLICRFRIRRVTYVTVHDGVSESPDRYDTFDLSDNLIFAIDGGIRNIRPKRVLCDYTGIPLPSMKTMVVHDFSWGGLICRFRICRRVTCNRRKYVQSTLDKISTSLSWFHICILFKIRSENDEL